MSWFREHFGSLNPSRSVIGCHPPVLRGRGRWEECPNLRAAATEMGITYVVSWHRLNRPLQAPLDSDLGLARGHAGAVVKAARPCNRRAAEIVERPATTLC